MTLAGDTCQPDNLKTNNINFNDQHLNTVQQLQSSAVSLTNVTQTFSETSTTSSFTQSFEDNISVNKSSESVDTVIEVVTHNQQTTEQKETFQESINLEDAHEQALQDKQNVAAHIETAIETKNVANTEFSETLTARNFEHEFLNKEENKTSFQRSSDNIHHSKTSNDIKESHLSTLNIEENKHFQDNPACFTPNETDTKHEKLEQSVENYLIDTEVVKANEVNEESEKVNKMVR